MTTLIKAALLVVIAGGALAVFNDPAILDTALGGGEAGSQAQGRRAPISSLDPQPGLAQFRVIPDQLGDGPESEAEHVRLVYGNGDPDWSDGQPIRPGDRVDAELGRLKRARDMALGDLQAALSAGYGREIEAARERFTDAETRFQESRRRLVGNR